MSDPLFPDRIGLRVRAILAGSDDPNDIDQPGTIVRAEPLELDREIHDVPVIRLDDGREWRGYECWWTADDRTAFPEHEATGHPRGGAACDFRS
jgi:hypothetical protein